MSAPNTSTRIALDTIAGALERAGLLVERRGVLPELVNGVSDDSRAVSPGSLFVAVRGSQREGHEYLDAAAGRGAVAAIVEDASRTTLPALVVQRGREAAAVAAAAAYGEPAERLSLVGVTGTNGKTTTVGILRHLLDRPERPSASIGTLGVLRGSEGVAVDGGGGLTTPGPVELQRVFRTLVDDGVRTVAMEVSSHSLDQRRIEGTRFDAAVFTNLTRDHLDYHQTMDAYRTAKARLLDYLAPDGVAVVNADDEAWAALGAAPRALTYSTRSARADFSVVDARFDADGSDLTLRAGDQSARARLPLIGDFNVSNAAAACAVAWALGMPLAEVAVRLESLPQVPGRLERIHTRPTVLRDYAHTPDALERAIAAVRPFAGAGRVIVVFGCGGDRDRGKRPEMGAIAARDADLAIVTSDNPRTEDPERILDDIEAGMGDVAHERIEDRRAAIAHALEIASADDVVMLAGKGHETYQVRGTTTHPFDEREIVRELTGAIA
jgi:UDP-N-acetylmuramoyl-L-alanyl-D-glutamate--2,6-diaminopimelate ligase